MNFRKILLVFFMGVSLAACGGDPLVEKPALPAPSIVETPPAELEVLNYDEQGVLRVKPNINSPTDLKAYKTKKIAEIERILEDTKEASKDKPYYPVVMTMSKPVSVVEMQKLLGKYNPSVAKVLKTTTVKYLPKAELVKNEDVLIVNSVKFVSTEGGGQLAYDTLTKEDEISKLEKQIAIKEKELNGVKDYQLIKGITSIQGGIHRDSILPMQKDPNVFLADIGPEDMYKGKTEMALWDDMYKEVEKHGEQK